MHGTEYRAQRVNKLTTKKVQGKLKPGMHNDGAGLCLRASKSGAQSWILGCRVHGTKRDIGLGGAATVPLADARKKAAAMRAVARDGGAPPTDTPQCFLSPTASRRCSRVSVKSNVNSSRRSLLRDSRPAASFAKGCPRARSALRGRTALSCISGRRSPRAPCPSFRGWTPG